MLKLAERLAHIKPSPTLAVTQKAKELQDQGIDVLSFSAGEPDFATPPHIVEACKRALDRGETRYTAVPGITSLRRTVAAQCAQLRHAPCALENVTITSGAKQALYNFFHAALDSGDEVLVPAPYWVSYPDQVLLAGGRPVILPTTAATGFCLAPGQIRAAAGPRTRALVLNSPSNPTGAVYPREVLAAITREALDCGLWIVADEIYRDLVYDGAVHVSPLELAPEAQRDQVFVVDGVSKSFAMTGWRIGWGIGPKELIQAMNKIQGQCTSNATTMAQHAALAALDGDQGFLDGWRTEYARRRDRMVTLLQAIPGVHCGCPQGAFYVMAEVSELIARLGPDRTDIDFSSWLIEEARVAVVPGSAFGAPGHIRFSYATSLAAIEEGVARMARAIDRL